MKSIADFEPMVIAASELAEDIHPTILQELIRDAIVDFMRSSGVAQDEYYFNAQCGVDDYLLDLPKCHILVAVDKVATSDCDGVYNDTWDEMPPQTDYRHGYYMDIHTAPNVSIVFDRPIEDKRVYVSYSYTISRDNCDVPDIIYETYADALVAGTIHRLKTRGGANRTLELEKFENAVALAKSRKLRKYSKGRRVAKAVSFLGRAI